MGLCKDEASEHGIGLGDQRRQLPTSILSFMAFLQKKEYNKEVFESLSEKKVCMN